MIGGMKWWGYVGFGALVSCPPVGGHLELCGVLVGTPVIWRALGLYFKCLGIAASHCGALSFFKRKAF